MIRLKSVTEDSNNMHVQTTRHLQNLEVSARGLYEVTIRGGTSLNYLRVLNRRRAETSNPYIHSFSPALSVARSQGFAVK